MKKKQIPEDMQTLEMYQIGKALG